MFMEGNENLEYYKVTINRKFIVFVIVMEILKSLLNIGVTLKL